MPLPLSAVLLAGGQSKRMGRDKAFLKIGGAEIWRYQLVKLRALAPRELFISGPPHPEWKAAGVQVIEDDVEDAGPLAGIAASLKRCTSPLLVVLAVDLPAMSPEFLRRLVEVSSSACGAVPRRHGRFEPLAAIYPKACLPLAQTLLDSRTLSLQTFCARALEQSFLREHPVEPTEEPLFLNLNTPENLTDALSGHS